MSEASDCAWARSGTSRRTTASATSSGRLLLFFGPGVGQATGQVAMVDEVVGQHADRGEDVADEDRPAGQLVEHPAGHDHDAAEEADLEGGEEDDEAEDQ